MPEQVSEVARVQASQHGKRLDQVAAELFPDFSRARLQDWIRSGELRLDGQQLRPRDRVQSGSELTLNATLEDAVHWTPEPISLDLVHADDDVIVVNKPVGLVVHPAAGNRDGTLVNALLHAFPELSELPRGGIVHRLDKDTSGLMMVARSQRAHTRLVEQLQQRAVKREYMALCFGTVTGSGTVDAAIGRHPVSRTRMAVVQSGGKPAVTHYRVEERFGHHTLLAIRLETGRTHQIRVHMAHRRHALVGDTVYAGRLRLPPGAAPELQQALRRFRRQALHARRLGFVHPGHGEFCEWQSPPPEDLQDLLTCLRQYDSPA
ncbi:MAG: 23S rRNA pseudouridine(1911/1915/1917) synthase RluD [Halieaceae bacterium]|jgi:23S rRNA pseudouridine1911/1915/1917 synthase|nr:23S rRNA pseudouridine(1911/1915/1917) synthase RluD [Halieaceae bacterium]